MKVTKEREIPTWGELTDEQKQQLVNNMASIMSRTSYLLHCEARNAKPDEDWSEILSHATDMHVADEVVNAILCGDEEEEFEERLDENFDGAKKAFDWLMDPEFDVAKCEVINPKQEGGAK